MSTLALALMLALSNCVKEDHPEPEPEPTAPDSELVDQINAIEVAQVTLVAPAPVQQTAGGVEQSAQTIAFNQGISSLTPGGPIPAAVTGGANAISAALSASEISALNSVSQATIDAIKNGGALPAELQAILDKAAANPALAAYLPKLTLPTVNGVTIGARTGAVEGTAGVEEIEVTDECINAANAAFQTAKTKLDNSRDTQLAGAATAYATAIAAVATAQSTCVSSVPAIFTPLRADAESQFNSLNAALDANQASLGSLYVLVKAQVLVVYLGYLSSLNDLQAASTQACSAVATAATTAAGAARDANNASIAAAYGTALAAADDLRKALIQSCHNQGGGL